MKKVTTFIGVILLLLVAQSMSDVKATNLDNIPTTVLYGNCDVNGDGLKENIYVKNRKENEITLIIKDSTNKKQLLTKKISEYMNDEDNYLRFIDFNGDGIKDIMGIFYVGGSDGRHECGVYSFKNNKFIELKSTNDSKNNGITTQDINMDLVCNGGKYYAKISSQKLATNYTLDISNNTYVLERKGEYEFREENQGPYYTTCDYNKDGKIELVKSMQYNGLFYADKIALINTYYTYKNGGWACLGYDIETGYPIIEKTVGNGKDISITKDNLDEFFKLTYGQIIKKYGDKIEEVPLEGAKGIITSGANIVFCFGTYDTPAQTDKLTSISLGENMGSSILGVKLGMSLQEIIKLWGTPKNKGYDDQYGREFAHYNLGKYRVYMYFENKYKVLTYMDFIEN